MNLLKETLADIKNSGHTPDQVMFVGSEDGKYRISFDKFRKIANFEYDDGFGSQKIAKDLIVYFTDGQYMTRDEYDGCEEWNYHDPKKFTPDEKGKPFSILGGDQFMWGSLAEMNKVNKEND